MRSRSRPLLLRCSASTRAEPYRCHTVHRSRGSCGTPLARRLSTNPLDSDSSDPAPHPSLRLSPPYPPDHTTAPIAAQLPTAEPLTVAEFSALLDRCGIPPNQQLAIGLSGGADSTALALLAHHEASHPHSRRPPPLLLQVDHSLRAESNAETRHTHHWLTQRLPHPQPHHIVLTLPWRGRPPTNRLQEAARVRRRGVLVAECVARRVGWLVLAHHGGDQLETVVHRWTRGSGLYGLTGMAQRWAVTAGSLGGASAERLGGDEEAIKAEDEERQQEHEKSVVICRPLLGVSKARLMATCRQHGVRWVEDVSNDNRAFERIRIRQALQAMLDHPRSAPQPSTLSSAPHLPPLTAALLASMPAILASCQQSVHAVTTSLLRRHTTLVSPFSVVFLSAAVAGLGMPVLLALLSRVLAVVRGSAHVSMGEPLPQVVRWLLRRYQVPSTMPTPGGVLPSRQVVFGCVISSLPGDSNGQQGGWMIARAMDHTTELPLPTTPAQAPTHHHRLRWDHRFHITLHTLPSPPPAGYARIDYTVRLLRKDDLLRFRLPVPAGAMRRLLLTGLPVLVRRWSRASSGGVCESGEDVVVVPHVPLLPLDEAGWDEAERVRRAGDGVQVTVTRVLDRVSKWDWTQREDDDACNLRNPGFHHPSPDDANRLPSSTTLRISDVSDSPASIVCETTETNTSPSLASTQHKHHTAVETSWD